MMTDPVADMLTRIRNAGIAGHARTRCPKSKLKLAIARVMKDEGYLSDVREDSESGRPVLVIDLRFDHDGANVIDGIRRVSKPGRRVYVAKDAVPRVRSGLGIAVLSTSKGVLSDRGARDAGVGGELLCEVW
jgi:small subunit ribosomal protein S8